MIFIEFISNDYCRLVVCNNYFDICALFY